MQPRSGVASCWTGAAETIALARSSKYRQCLFDRPQPLQYFAIATQVLYPGMNGFRFFKSKANPTFHVKIQIRK